MGASQIPSCNTQALGKFELPNNNAPSESFRDWHFAAFSGFGHPYGIDFRVELKEGWLH